MRFIMSISVARDVGTCQMIPVNMGMYEKGSADESGLMD